MIEQAFIIAMIVLFLHFTTWDGEIFEFVKKLIKPEGKLYKPIYGCPACMTPWYGTILYFLFFNNSFQDWLLTVGAASGISVINVLLLTIKDILENDRKQTQDP